jgi:DNA adenine methylase
VKVMRPLLRYHGGKWRMAQKILAQMPAHRNYTEPFGGAASVLLQKPRAASEVYNDLDGELVSLFEVVRDRGAELAQKLADTPYSRTEFERSYFAASCRLEQARRTVVRSFMGFGSAAASGANTGFRSQTHGSGGSAAHDWRRLPAHLDRIIDRLRGVVLENCDASDVLTRHDAADTLHYVDPPYVMSTRKMKNPWCSKGYRHEMTDEAHTELANVLRELGGMVMLSGYPSPLYSSLYQDWHCVQSEALADGARERVECLWFNSAAWSRRPQMQLLDIEDCA